MGDLGRFESKLCCANNVGGNLGFAGVRRVLSQLSCCAKNDQNLNRSMFLATVVVCKLKVREIPSDSTEWGRMVGWDGLQ